MKRPWNTRLHIFASQHQRRERLRGNGWLQLELIGVRSGLQRIGKQRGREWPMSEVGGQLTSKMRSGRSKGSDQIGVIDNLTRCRKKLKQIGNIR